MSTLTIVTGILQEANEKNNELTEKLQKQQQENDGLKDTRRLMLCAHCTYLLDNHTDGELCLCERCESYCTLGWRK